MNKETILQNSGYYKAVGFYGRVSFLNWFIAFSAWKSSCIQKGIGRNSSGRYGKRPAGRQSPGIRRSPGIGHIFQKNPVCVVDIQKKVKLETDLKHKILGIYWLPIYYIVNLYIDNQYKEGMYMAANKAWISGSAKMLLKLLSEKDMYGYEMITTLRKRSQNVFELKAGTLYPLLHTMEEEELLTSYEEEVLGKTRKYYRITKNGERLLKSKEEEWEEYSTAVTAVLKWEG